MIVYEVNCLLDIAIKDEFMEWLPSHIRDLLAIEGFVSAETLIIQDDAHLSDLTNSTGISVRYFLKDQNTLDNYVSHHAEKLRQEGKARFGNHLSTYRRVLL